MRAKDRSAFIEWASSRGGSLRGIAYLIVGDYHLAEDLVQEALTKVYVAWPRIRDVSKAEAYARRTIATTAISWSRRKSSTERPQEFLPERAADDALAPAVVNHEWIWRELLELPVRQRTAIVLRHYEDLSVAETAEYMGCSAGTVKSQSSRGLAVLRERLGTDLDEMLSVKESAS